MGRGDAPETQELAEQVTAYFAALPADRYPHMKAVAQVHITEIEQFEYGLQRLLDGLADDLARPTDSSAADRGAEPGTGNVMLRR